VGVEAHEPVGHRLRVGEDHVGRRPVARHAIDDVVDVQDRPRAAQRRQQPPAHGRVQVDDVEALGQPQRTRPGRHRARSLAVPEPADVEAHPGVAGLADRPLARAGERDLPAAVTQPSCQAQQPDFRAAGVIDGVHGQELHVPGRVLTWR
jgi:hypothetical protein